MTLLAWLINLVVLIYVYRRMVERYDEPRALFFYFYSLVFLIRPLLIITGLDTFSPEYLFGSSDDLLALAMLYSAFWLLLILAGDMTLTRLARGLAKALPPPQDIASRSPLWLIAVGITVVSLTIVWSLLSQYGSYAGMIYASKVSKDLAGQNYLRMAPTAGAIMSSILMLSIAHDHFATRSVKRWLPKVLTAFALVLINLGVTTAWGTRTEMAVILTALMCGWSISVRRIPVWLALTGITTFLVLLFSLSLAREIAVTGHAYSLNVKSLAGAMSTSLHASEFDAFILVLRDWMSPKDIRWGTDFWNGMAGMIPRGLWPARPDLVIPGKAFRQIYEPYMHNGWPFTPLGEWLLNFGKLGFIFGGLLSGACLRAIALRYGDHWKSRPAASLTAGVIIVIVLANGFDTGTMMQFMFFIAPIWLCLFLYWNLASIATKGQGRPAPVWSEPSPAPRN